LQRWSVQNAQKILEIVDDEVGHLVDDIIELESQEKLAEKVSLRRSNELSNAKLPFHAEHVNGAERQHFPLIAQLHLRFFEFNRNCVTYRVPQK